MSKNDDLIWETLTRVFTKWEMSRVSRGCVGRPKGYSPPKKRGRRRIYKRMTVTQAKLFKKLVNAGVSATEARTEAMKVL